MSIDENLLVVMYQQHVLKTKMMGRAFNYRTLTGRDEIVVRIRRFVFFFGTGVGYFLSFGMGIVLSPL